MNKNFLIALAIGLIVGAVGAFSVAQALANRGAHPRANMVVLARQVDHLRHLQDDAACAAEKTTVRMQQVHFAAREIDFAFTAQVQADPAFARRSQEFQTVTAVPAQLSSCAELDSWLTEVRRGCQACHRDYR